MRIGGLQKLTLLDYPGKTACTVFTVGCNFRCPFCHNAALVTHPNESGDADAGELFELLERRRGTLDGVCISGGEPLLQPELSELLTEIKKRGFLTKLDTNGSFPDRLRRLVDAGLVDYVAMDVKNSPGRYALTAGVEHAVTAAVGESISFLLLGKVDYEFRTTVVRELHDSESLADTAKSIKGARRYYLQKFVDSGDTIAGGMSAYSDAEMRELLKAVEPFVQYAALRGV